MSVTPHQFIHCYLAQASIRPPERTRSRFALTLAEREEISCGLNIGLSLRAIARSLEPSPSTISREVERHGGLAFYRAVRADKSAWERACRPKLCKLACSAFLRQIVTRKLQKKWSPQQIAGWLKRSYPGDSSKHVSHETIYRSLYVQARGVLKKELMTHLRASRRTIRRSRHASLKRDGLGQITKAVSISERPAEAENRAVPGHWEGDLIAGSKQRFIATLVERHSRYVMLVKVPGKETAHVTQALTKHAKKLPKELYKSLTWDKFMRYSY